MIGLSLSFCVGDILAGRVSISEVDKLVTGTKCKTVEDFDKVFEQYKRHYWYKFSDNEIDAVLEKLKPIIYQPRLSENKFPIISDGYWVNNLDNIEWRNEHD